MCMPIKIVIIDDHEVVRAGLRAFIDTEPDVDVTGDATNEWD